MGPVPRAFTAFLALLLWMQPASPTRAAPAEVETMSACVDRIAAKTQAVAAKTQPEPTAREQLWDAASLCQTLLSSQRANDEQQIRADNFVFQRSENVVLMWMVVSITLAGVALAAVQLLASYFLAKAGRGNLAEGGSIALSKDKLAVQSSVVGVIVLAISFAFFMVFVLYVYTFQDPNQGKDQKARVAEEALQQLSSGPLQPLLPASPPKKQEKPE
jgi:hypothetical protein